MSEETSSTVTGPFEIDLFEFLRVVNEGASQDSNELLQTECARARHLSDEHQRGRATDSHRALTQPDIRNCAQMCRKLRAGSMQTLLGAEVPRRKWRTHPTLTSMS